MKRIYQFIIICLLFLHLGCKKFIQVDPPTNKVVGATIFTSDATATAAINGLYSIMANSGGFAAGGSTVYLGMYADELRTTLTTASALEFQNSSLSITNSVVNTQFWRSSYALIYQANSCIKGLESSSINPALRTQLLGEAYFIRAFCYWNLVRLFGDVPLVLTVDDYQAVAQMSRTSSTQVIARILGDLGEAKTRLIATYPSAGRYRPNLYTVSAMLSRVHTYLGNWNEVLTNSNEVIAQSSYQLEADLNRVFLVGSTEAIWQNVQDVEFANTSEAQLLIPGTAAALPAYVLQPNVINSFSSIDKRKLNWMTSKTVSGNTYTYPFKYKVRSSAVKTECQMMIRLAEIYLNRAEAKARLNDNTALDDLNKIRTRAGLESLTSLTGQALLDTIIQERRAELFAEWGFRWFDLKRSGQLSAVLTALKPNWTATSILFPIPEAEILTAPNLTQNPGYN